MMDSRHFPHITTHITGFGETEDGKFRNFRVGFAP